MNGGAPAKSRPMQSTAHGDAAPADVPLLSARLLNELGLERRARHRELRQAGRGAEVYQFVDQAQEARTDGVTSGPRRSDVAAAQRVDGLGEADDLHAAVQSMSQAAGADSRNQPAPAAHDGGDEEKEDRTQHLMCRLLALGFVVPLMDRGAAGRPDNLCRHDCSVGQALAVLRREIIRRPRVLGHAFRCGQGGRNADNDPSPSTMKSTTLDMWLAPRLFVGAAMLLARGASASDAESARQCWDLAWDAAHLLELLLELAYEHEDHLDNVRILLGEFMRVSIEALANEGRPAFLSKFPPPSWMQPIESQRGDVFLAKQTADGRLGVLRRPVGPQGELLPDPPRDRMSGDGIINLWMPEDHTPFDVALSGKGSADQVKARNFAQALLTIACRTALVLGNRAPAVLLDQADIATSLLLSAWACEEQNQVMEPHQSGDRPALLRAAHISCAAVALADARLGCAQQAKLGRQLANAMRFELMSVSYRVEGANEPATLCEKPLAELRILFESASSPGGLPRGAARALADAIRLVAPHAIAELEANSEGTTSLEPSARSMNASEKDGHDLLVLRKRMACAALVMVLGTRTDGPDPLTLSERGRLRTLVEGSLEGRHDSSGGLARDTASGQVRDMEREWLSHEEWQQLGRALQSSEKRIPSEDPRPRKRRRLSGLAWGTSITAFEQAVRSRSSERLACAADSICRLACGAADVDASSPDTWICPLCEPLHRRRGTRASVRLAQDVKGGPDPSTSRRVYDAARNILADSADPGNARVLLGCVDMLRACLVHLDAGYEEIQLDVTGELVWPLFSHPDRSVRVAASRLIEALVRRRCILHHEGAEPGALRQHLRRVFRQLEKSRDSASGILQETSLITMGALASVPHDDVQQPALLGLVLALGRGPFQQALAYTQLTGLAAYFGCTPFQLLAPALPSISPIVVARMIAAPALFDEVLNLTAQSTAKFLQGTLQYILPHLVELGDRKLLGLVAREIGQEIAEMCFNHAPAVLKHFLAEPPEKRRHGIKYLLTVVFGIGSGHDVGLRRLVKSYLVELLGHLIVRLGDPETKPSALQGLLYLEAVDQGRNDELSQAQREFALPRFLGREILAILAWINDELTSGHGKKTLSHKAKAVRSVGQLIQIVGEEISMVIPQLMATLNSTVSVPALMLPTLETWRTLVTSMRYEAIGPFIGQTAATILSGWPRFGPQEKAVASDMLRYIVIESETGLKEWIRTDLPDLDELEPELPTVCRRLRSVHCLNAEGTLLNILERVASENSSVCAQALQELKRFLRTQYRFIEGVTSGDMFSPVVSRCVSALLIALGRGEDTQWADAQALCFECFGLLGAVDPDRLEMPAEEPPRVVLQNFADRDESIDFAVHLVRDLLVGAFRATDDTKHQAALAFAIQELLKFCGFTSALFEAKPVALKVKQRWNNLPASVKDTVAPLLESKYSLQMGETSRRVQPFYLHARSYRDWIQVWTNDLICNLEMPDARTIFQLFRPLVRNQDLGIAQHILPHLVLTTIISSDDVHRAAIHAEISAVLQDQVQPQRRNNDHDPRAGSAQTVFRLLDHINAWARRISHERSAGGPHGGVNAGAGQGRRMAPPQAEALSNVMGVTGSISNELMAEASLKCREYARSLLNFESRIRDLRLAGRGDAELQPFYENLHKNYAELEEPDGMEGVSTRVVDPSLELQIREHESTGRWTSAQSCWEVVLGSEANANDVTPHVGLLRCLRNLGHFDTMRTHVRGVVSARPDWQPALATFEVESSFLRGNWADVRKALGDVRVISSPEHAIARVLVAICDADSEQLSSAIRDARQLLGRPIIAAGSGSYPRIYEAVAQLHRLEELTMIGELAMKPEVARDDAATRQMSETLRARFNLTQPSFRIREPLLSLRRSALQATKTSLHALAEAEIGPAWLQTARMARKAGHLQTAYSAVLQANAEDAPLAFVQRAKLLALTDQPQAAIQELNNNLQRLSSAIASAGLATEATSKPAHAAAAANAVATAFETMGEGTEADATRLKRQREYANANLFRARLLEDKGRCGPNEIIERYKESSKLDQNSEKAWYYLGRYYDGERDVANAMTQKYSVCRYFFKSAQCGTKFFFRTVPRVLTLWFEAGDDPVIRLHAGDAPDSAKNAQQPAQGGLPDRKQDPVSWEKVDSFGKINALLERGVRKLRPYQWLAVLPQLVSRIVHQNPDVWRVLLQIMVTVLEAYPDQGMWATVVASQSTDRQRRQRFKEIVGRVNGRAGTSTHLSRARQIIQRMQKMAVELLGLCNHPVKSETTLNLHTQFPGLSALADSTLILPLQSSITANLPSDHSAGSEHQPFPANLPRISGFEPLIEIMNSLQKPRKITIVGSDGRRYAFLGKPNDDLRKDARLMEFDAMINKLLQSNSESRKRRLYVRTYAVVTLNEECGLIEWVPNTVALRHVLQKLYSGRSIPLYSHALRASMEQARKDRDGGKLFELQVLSKYPALFHEWFLETFPEPSAWFRARLAYARTLAVMSMVGYVLGLGDRHGENILFDSMTGDTVHVDLNCLFEKGLTFEIPERVPFRLTQNLVDALGVTGVEGVFRRAAEISMAILRANKDSLMSVLEAMIHDPLGEWGPGHGKTKRSERQPDPRVIEGRRQLENVAKKLDGCIRQYGGGWSSSHSTNNFVEFLIRDATSSTNLSQMYVGWASYL